jgi:hypothetical protein
VPWCHAARSCAEPSNDRTSRDAYRCFSFQTRDGPSYAC